MEGMFNPMSILLHTLNAVILLTALYLLLLKPVRRFMGERESRIAAEIDKIGTATEKMNQQMKAAHQEVASARKMAADTIAHSVDQAREQAQRVLDGAHENADQILKSAAAEAESIRKAARDEMRGEVTGLSVALASKLLQREITKADHEKMIEDFLKKVE